MPVHLLVLVAAVVVAQVVVVVVGCRSSGCMRESSFVWVLPFLLSSSVTRLRLMLLSQPCVCFRPLPPSLTLGRTLVVSSRRAPRHWCFAAQCNCLGDLNARYKRGLRPSNVAFGWGKCGFRSCLIMALACRSHNRNLLNPTGSVPSMCLSLCCK